MARKSRYTGSVQKIPEIRPHCIAAIYLRLSVEMGTVLKATRLGIKGKSDWPFWKSTAILKLAHFMWMMAAQV